MVTQVALVTVEEFLKLPEPREGHSELHHGEVVVMPPPKNEHQVLQDRIQMALKELLRGRGAVRMEMAFRPMPEYEVWAADVGYVSSERHQAVAPDAYLQGAPDLVVEVLSPGNTSYEIKDKMSICLNNGCVSFWVVDPKSKQVSITEVNVTTHYGLSDAISSSLLQAEILVRNIFE